MLSKAKIKLIRSLELKKNRQSAGLFVAEGPKVVGDLLSYFRPRFIVATRAWLAAGAFPPATEVIEVTEDELSKASFLKTPQEVLAVFEMEGQQDNESMGQQMDAGRTQHVDPLTCGLVDLKATLTLVLDDVQDPGNLGTIIRTADWFGIRRIICSPGTADAFSPKVVQATMGSIARVRICYTDLPSFLASLPAGTPVYGTYLEGRNIYHHPLSQGGILIMGNEGNGISPAVSHYVTEKLFIPPYPTDAVTGESLNVAIATAITCAEFRRRAGS